MSFPKLRYFTESEFRDWAAVMDYSFLFKLDDLRAKSGFKMLISPHPKALGRTTGSRTSQHFWDDTKDSLKVADIIPYVVTPDRQHRGLTVVEMKGLVATATNLGFTGIGVYPMWKPFPGLHLDLREPRHPRYVAKWSRVMVGGKKGYMSITAAWRYYYESVS